MKKSTVISYGTFDIFHVGHLRLIKSLKELGDNLIIAVSTDEFNSLKGKECIIPFSQRKEIVENIKGVDLVIPEESWDQKIKDIQEYGVDLFVMGDDWRGKFDYLKDHCEVRYLPRTVGISSTSLKVTLSEPVFRVKAEIDKMFKIMETIKKDLE